MHCDSSVRNELLDLLPVAANRFGLKRRALEHLIWLIRHTRVMDWDPGNRAVVYKSVSDTAAERQVSVRQIYNYEQEIAESIRGRINEGTNLRELEARIITAGNARRDLGALLLRGKSCGSDVKISDTSEKNFRPIDPTTDLQTDHRSGCSPDGDNPAGKPARAARPEARPGALSCRNPKPVLPEFLQDFDGPAFVPPEKTGAHRIRAHLALRAATPRFQAHMPLEPRQPIPDDVIDAAKSLLPELKISRGVCRYACQIVRPYPAALCVLVTDHAAAERELRSPGGYFRSMAKRALTGELALDRSIFGFLNG